MTERPRRALADRIVAASWLGDELCEPAGAQGFGRYEVLRVLGQGASSEVLLAEDPTLKRLVAIKALHPRPGLSEERFVQEMQVLADLRHPNIVGIHDVGVSAQNRPFFVMEFGGEQTLADRELSLTETVGVLEQVARACHYAHERQVVHRDLKPANIILGEEQPLVADFGVAKLLGRETGTTAAGALVGTPAYMAPEQIGGGEVGPWTDVHALGIILYEQLTGQLPYAGETLQELVTQIALGQPRPPRELAPDVPAELEAITLAALAPAPADRPSALALAERLSGWARGDEDAVDEVRDAEPGVPVWLGPTLGLILLALVGLGILALRPRPKPPDSRPAAATSAPPPASTPSALPQPSASASGPKPTPDPRAALRAWRRAFAARITGEPPPQAVPASGPLGPALEALFAGRLQAASRALAAAAASPERALLQAHTAILAGALEEAGPHLARAGAVEGVAAAGLALQLARARRRPGPRAAQRLLRQALQLLREGRDPAASQLFSACWRWLARVTGRRRARNAPSLLTLIEEAERLLGAQVSETSRDAALIAALGNVRLVHWVRFEPTAATWGRAQTLFERAARHDPGAAGPHLSLGLLHLLRAERTDAGAPARRAARAALEAAGQRASSPELEALRQVAREQAR